MKIHNLYPPDPTSFLGFLKNFNFACDINGIHESAAMGLFHFLINNSASAVLNAYLSANFSNRKSSRKTTVKWRYLTTYLQKVNVLLQAIATYEIIAETESAITTFAQPAATNSLKYAKKLVAKTVCCGDVYKE